MSNPKTVADLRAWLRYASPDAEIIVTIPRGRLLGEEGEGSAELRSFLQVGLRCELAVEGARLEVPLQLITDGEARATTLARENSLVLQISQALLGSVSRNLRAVSVDVGTDSSTVHFLLATDSSRDREEVEDVMCDLESLTAGLESCIPSIHVSSRPDARGSLPGRLIYCRQEDPGESQS